jgi:hypothetical protein
MNTVIGKKQVHQIQVGDVVGLIGEWLNFTDEHDERLVTVLFVQQAEEMNHVGTWLTSKIYQITCSDGNTYEITGGSREYFIFAQKKIMNCDYCGNEVETSEVTMTDMGDQVCTPCLIGKPAEIVTLDFIPTK